jgi:hypothetical protein
MIHNRLESGEDFSALAQNLSENPNDANNGGNMGFIPESSLRGQPPPIFAAISKLQPGQMTNVTPLLRANSECAASIGLKGRSAVLGLRFPNDLRRIFVVSESNELRMS